MGNEMVRRILAPVFGAALCLAAMPYPGAAGRDVILEQFTGKAISVSGPESAGRIDIYIERWSTDDEVSKLHDALPGSVGNPLGGLLPALRLPKPRAGVVLMPGIQGFGARARTRTPRNLWFARAVVGAAGRQVVVASDQHIGLGERGVDARKSIDEFSLVDIRFGADGTGIGKLGVAADVDYSPAAKVIEMRNYDAHPTRLVDVRAEKP